jgi:hypothetical protein
MRIQIPVTTPPRLTNTATAAVIPPPYRPLYRASSTRASFIQTSLWRAVLFSARACSASAMSSLRRRMQRILFAPGIFRAVQIAMKRLFSRGRASESALSAASARWAASSLAASGSPGEAGLSGSDSLIICSRVPNALTGREHRPCFDDVRAAVSERVTHRRYGPVGKTVPGRTEFDHRKASQPNRMSRRSEVAPDEGCRGQRDRARRAPGCARS